MAHARSERGAKERGRATAAGGRAALRHSLLARMLAGSILVAVCSITATAWVAVQGTSESLNVEQGETLAVDTRIHDALMGYAATHPEWDGVQDAVDELAAETDRRIALTTENRRPIADSAASGSEAAPALPPRTSSVVDPLAVDVTFSSDAADRIDPRAVGPFALDEADRSELAGIAERAADCLMTDFGITADVATGPSGRPVVDAPDAGTDPLASSVCGLDALAEPTASEQEALTELNDLIADCLEPHDLEAVYRIDAATGGGEVATSDPRPFPMPDDAQAPGDLPGPVEEEDDPRENAPAPDPSAAPGDPDTAVPPVEPPQDAVPDPSAASSAPPREPAPAVEPTAAPSTAAPPPVPPETDPRIAACVDTARRDQLGPYVAPAALLFIDDPDSGAEPGLALSREGVLRVSGVVLLILVLTVVVSVVLSTRLVRPVHALTAAVQRMRDGDRAARVAVRDSGEIGRLARAFNEMSEHLERLEEQRKAMVSDVSHELRTPLSNLRGWLEAAQDGVAELEPERMTMLIKETLLLQRIIDDLQELALADAGKLRLTPEPVDVRDLVEQVVASHRLRAESAGLRLVTDAADVPMVADRARLLQAIGNLVGNALRHTPAPGTVTVRARGEGRDAVIEVADTGVGISPEDLPQVFSRFWRAEKSRNRRTGGSGLGLAIVRNLTELHGGTAEAASTVGEGSVFTLRLPLEGPLREDEGTGTGPGAA
ncbi:sensor histidine kinase [Nocardiopsis mangrovi]|uniref:histidine kinase n=1 Tax=Nocardiopsis mangrovi TaxID=1179818 RepID=A0ABV9DXV9_9ACTN